MEFNDRIQLTLFHNKMEEIARDSGRDPEYAGADADELLREVLKWYGEKTGTIDKVNKILEAYHSVSRWYS